MNPNKALWEKGDFTKIAEFMRESGESLVDSLGVRSTDNVLDLGCGDGTTALPLAKRAAQVKGVDIATNLVAAGRERARASGLENLTFDEGDACRLDGLGNDSFDLSLTVFGAMFAPDPDAVAANLVRVTKPGGRIVMGNWIPNDPTSFISKLLKISMAYAPPPPAGFISPMTWGVEANIADRFGKAGVAADGIAMERDTFYFKSQDESPEQFIERFRDFYGPTMNAYAAAEKDGKADALHTELVELANNENAANGAGTSIPASFMRVTVRV